MVRSTNDALAIEHEVQRQMLERLGIAWAPGEPFYALVEDEIQRLRTTLGIYGDHLESCWLRQQPRVAAVGRSRCNCGYFDGLFKPSEPATPRVASNEESSGS